MLVSSPNLASGIPAGGNTLLGLGQRKYPTGLLPGGGRWRVQHNIFKVNGKKAVHLDLEGMILDLAARTSVLPSPELLAVFQAIPRSAGFEVLPELRRARAT